ncbi:MAG: dockerin type I repeat-containing protein, partial [Muribaculaceae bacterium]|nr:dockerin type I repeat-containing protein [Muribaculaceae bacterium]
FYCILEPGDVNLDGKVNVSDISTLINMILGIQGESATGDVNGDGKINVSDVTALINLILGITPEEPVAR